jgi:hypothetical protein
MKVNLRKCIFLIRKLINLLGVKNALEVAKVVAEVFPEDATWKVVVLGLKEEN